MTVICANAAEHSIELGRNAFFLDDEGKLMSARNKIPSYLVPYPGTWYLVPGSREYNLCDTRVPGTSTRYLLTVLGTWYLVPVLVPGTSAGTRYMVVNGYLVPGTGI